MARIKYFVDKETIMTTENTEEKVSKVYYELVYSVDSSFSVTVDGIPVSCEGEEEFINEARNGTYDHESYIELEDEEVDTDPYSADIDHDGHNVVSMYRIIEYGNGRRKQETIFE
jgi:hypothetical protein